MKKDINSSSIEQLCDVVKQIELLIEDNNQNIKDCNNVLRQIKKHVCPEKSSIIASVIRKLLNRK